MASSNKRAGAASASSEASLGIGAAVAGSMLKSSFAANRAARSIRTGSSR